MYIFPNFLTLDPGVQYFFYESSPISVSGDNSFSGGQQFFSLSASSKFVGQFGAIGQEVSTNFTVSGFVVSAAVPEPSALMVLAAALLGFELLRRYRKNS